MNRFLLSGSALGALVFLAIAPSQAADAVIEPAAAFAPSWSGFYIGIHGGGAFGNYDYTPDMGNPGFAYDLGDKRFILGFHAGYDRQFSDRWVGGVELDITNIDSVIAPFFGDDDLFWLNWQASATARLGYLVSPETLLYTRAGLSFLDVEAIEGFTDIADETVTAGRIGFGAETFLTPNVTARVEANYFRALDDFTTADDSSYDVHLLTATAGLTYRFGAEAGSSFGAAEAPQADWQGFSVGAYGAYGFGVMELDIDVPLATVGPFADETPLAGVFVGYDFAVNDRLVLGVEAEVAWLRARFSDPAGNGLGVDSPTLFGTVDALFGVSARAGLTVTPSTLVYVKGGFAGLMTEAEEDFFALDGGGEEVLAGYQVGVGIESALTEQVSLRVEATYVEAVEGITVTNTQDDQNTLTPSLLLGKAGLAWRW